MNSNEHEKRKAELMAEVTKALRAFESSKVVIRAHKDQLKSFAKDLSKRHGTAKARRILAQHGHTDVLPANKHLCWSDKNGKVIVEVEGRPVSHDYACSVGLFAMVRWDEQGGRPYEPDGHGGRKCVIRVTRRKPVKSGNLWASQLVINEVPYTLLVMLPVKVSAGLPEELRDKLDDGARLVRSLWKRVLATCDEYQQDWSPDDQLGGYSMYLEIKVRRRKLGD